jgi:hypothetical protein
MGKSSDNLRGLILYLVLFAYNDIAHVISCFRFILILFDLILIK